MPRSVMPAAALLLALLAVGCHTPYWRSRTLDALDTVPASLAFGYGVGLSVHATPLVHAGLGFSPIVTQRYGYEDRRLYGAWQEYAAFFPWSLWVTHLTEIPARAPGTGGFLPDGVPVAYYWQLDRDALQAEGHDSGNWEPIVRQWGRHPPYVRELGGGFGYPAPRRELAWRDLQTGNSDEQPLARLSAPERATMWQVEREGVALPPALDLFRIDVHLLLFGVRLGVRPLEFVDFLAGVVGLDPLQDDVDEPTHRLPPLDELEERADAEASAAAPAPAGG